MDISRFQFGIDIATSLAIFFSALTFLINQRLKTRETKRRQLDESVRAVTVNEFQSAISDLSKIYVKEIVDSSMPLQNYARRGLDNLQTALERHPERIIKIRDSISLTRSAMSRYIDSICAYNYQIYPLLDSIEGGDGQILAFRKSLDSLMKSYSLLGGSHEALLNEANDLAEFCRSHPWDTVDKEHLETKVLSIISDADYRQWVDTFIPSGKEDAYWECIDQGSFDAQPGLLSQVASNMTSNFYQSPERMLAQVVYLSYPPLQEARSQCKDFLVSLSAINYWLIRKGGEKESLPAVIERYRSPAVFDTETTIR